MVITLDTKDVDEILNRKKKENLKLEAEIKTDNRILPQTMFFLGLVSLISYCLLKPGLFDVYFNFSSCIFNKKLCRVSKIFGPSVSVFLDQIIE